MIDAGKLTEIVVVQSAVETRNHLGETTLSWNTYATRWASVEGVTASESLDGQQSTSVTHNVQMRYLDGLTTQMRLYWRGRTLEIISLLEHGRRSEHQLICQEAV